MLIAGRRVAIILMVTLILAACGEKEAANCPTPSGFPVPRFVSLKFDEMNARQGPGEDHKILWVWRAKGMPLQVVAENSDWRRVQGPDGVPAWVRKQGVTGRRMVIRTLQGDLPMLEEPKAGSKVVAYLKSGAIAALDKSDKGWSRIKAGGVSGWVPDAEVWGSGPLPKCSDTARR